MMTESLCPTSSSDSSAVKQALGEEPSSSTTNIPCTVSPPSLQQLGVAQQHVTLPTSHDVATTVAICQVYGCTEVLVKSYCLKKRACTAHMQAEAVQLTAEDKLYRFCQQCGKFEHVSKFDNKKRSCRARLAKRRSGTRAQLIKKGCSSRLSVSPPLSRSTSNAAAETQAAIAAAADLLDPYAVSDNLQGYCGDWVEQQLIEPRPYSASIPIPAGSLIKSQQQLQPGNLRVEDIAAQQTGDSRIKGECRKHHAAAICGTGQSLSDDVAASGQTAATAAGRQVRSAPLLRLPGSYHSGFGTAAEVDDVTMDLNSVTEMLELDDLHQDTLRNMTEADLVAALQQELEVDSAAWQHQQQPLEQQQQLRHSFHAPAAAPASCSAAVAAVFKAAAQGASTAAAAVAGGVQPALISMSSLGSQGQYSSGVAATASGEPSGSALEASGCSIPLAKLQLNPVPARRMPLPSYSYASAPLPQLSSHSALTAASQRQRQEVPLPDPLPTLQPCGTSTRLQWLVQQVQAELQHCDTEDLSALNEAELATLLHAALTPASVPDKSDNSSGAAAGGGGGGSTGATPAPISKVPGSTAAAAAAAAASAALACSADQHSGLLQQQHGFDGSQHIVSAASPTSFAKDFLVGLNSTGSSTSILSRGAIDGPASNTAPLPILGSVAGMGDSLARSYSSGVSLQHQASEPWPCQQYAMQQQQRQLQVRMAQLQQSQQVVAAQLTSISPASFMQGATRNQQLLQLQQQLQRQQLASLVHRTKGILDSLGPSA